MRILVTGANGYLGQGIVKAIIESGNKVIATDFKLDNVDTRATKIESPDDFINLVKYSKIVCTDSFHGTVFSLIFEKKFFTFMRFSDTETLSTNSRISTLLNLTGCEDRLVSNNVDVYEMLSRRMNNKCIQDNLNEFRRDSLEYLKRSLERK